MKIFIRYYFRNFANFKGVMSRKEYWMFALMSCIIFLLLGLLGGGLLGFSAMAEGLLQIFSSGFGILLLSILGVLVVFYPIPSLAATVRRLRDAGKSPYWILWLCLPNIITLILYVVYYCTRITIIWSIAQVFAYIIYGLTNVAMIILLCLPTKNHEPHDM